MTKNYDEEPRPVRKIPTKEQLEAIARRQAASEASIQEYTLSIGHTAQARAPRAPEQVQAFRLVQTTVILKRTMRIIKPVLIQAAAAITFHPKKSINKGIHAITSGMLTCHRAAADKRDCHPKENHTQTR